MWVFLIMIMMANSNGLADLTFASFTIQLLIVSIKGMMT